MWLQEHSLASPCLNVYTNVRRMRSSRLSVVCKVNSNAESCIARDLRHYNPRMLEVPAVSSLSDFRVSSGHITKFVMCRICHISTEVEITLSLQLYAVRLLLLYCVTYTQTGGSARRPPWIYIVYNILYAVYSVLEYIWIPWRRSTQESLQQWADLLRLSI